MLGLGLAVLLFGGWGGSGADIPWWALIGGPLGALYVIATLEAVPAIGAAGVGAGSIVGGLLFGIAADALGILGLKVQPMDIPRVCAVLGLVAGMSLVLARSPKAASPERR
jgi:transporter family-2 protein